MAEKLCHLPFAIWPMWKILLNAHAFQPLPLDNSRKLRRNQLRKGERRKSLPKKRIQERMKKK